MDTSAYQASNLKDIESYFESLQLEGDAVFRPGFDNHFSLLALTTWKWKSQ